MGFDLKYEPAEQCNRKIVHFRFVVYWRHYG